MPRWMQNRGDRLVYSSGIVVLAVISSIIVAIFHADEIAMLPLYALGVMLSFTLSQAGMSRLMSKVGQLKPGETAQTDNTHIHYERTWRWKKALNTVGSITTGVVFIILTATKFLDGAWIVALTIPLLVILFKTINNHYKKVSISLSTKTFSEEDLMDVADVAIVPIADVHRGTLRALQYAKLISTDVRAVCVSTSPGVHERLERRWARFPKLTKDIKLVIIDYDYRDILAPLVDYVDRVNRLEFDEQLVTIVIPEFVPEESMANVLHNQTANILRRELRNREDVIVIDVPYHIPAVIEENGNGVKRPSPAQEPTV